MRDFSHTVLRNSAFGLGAQLAIKVLSFVFSVLIIRNLGAEAFGQYAAIGAFGAVFIFIADLGLSPYVVRQVARIRATNNDPTAVSTLYGNVIALKMPLSAVAGVAMLTFAFITQRPAEMILGIAINVIGLLFYGAQGASEAVLSGYERLDITSKARVFQQLIFVVLGGVALMAGMSYFGLLFANLVGIIALLALCWRGVKQEGLRPGRAVPSEWPNLLRAALPFGIVGFTLGLSYKFDTVLLDLFRTPTEAGFYNAAYNLIFSAVVLSNVFNTSLYPSLARRAASSEQSIINVYDRALGYLMVIAIPLAIGMFALSDQLVLFLFKADFAPTANALAVLAWVVPLIYASEFLGYVVLINGKEKGVARSVAISTACNVAINLFVVPRYGFMGAAVVTVLTEAILVAQYLYILRDDMKQLDWGRIFVRPMIAATIMGLALAVFKTQWLFVNIAIGAAVYIALVLALRVLGKDEIVFVRGLVRRAEAPAA